MNSLKSQIALRLRRFAEEKYDTLAELAALLDMKPQSLQSYLTGKSVPGGELLAKLIDLGCDSNWLLTGEVSGIDLDNSLLIEKERNSKKSKEFPILGKIPAGIAEFHDLSDWPERHTLEYNPETHFFLKVDEEFGYSMMPLVNPGDLVLVSTIAKVKDNDLVVALYDKTKGALKIMVENKRLPDVISLISYNQAIAPIILPKDEVKLFKVLLIEKNR